jgi:hypothetical protein
MSRDLLGALWLLVDDLGDARTFDGYRAKCLVVDGAQGPRSFGEYGRAICELDRTEWRLELVVVSSGTTP